jgi:hypothetical protein
MSGLSQADSWHDGPVIHRMVRIIIKGGVWKVSIALLLFQICLKGLSYVS